MSQINLCEVSNRQIKVGQLINAKVKELKHGQGELFITYKVGSQEWTLLVIYMMPNDYMQVFYKIDGEFESPLHVSEVLPIEFNNFKLNIGEIQSPDINIFCPY